MDKSKSGFIDTLRKRGYEVQTQRLSGGNINNVNLVTAQKGDEVLQYVLKQYGSKRNVDTMLRGYDKISPLIKTPAIVYSNLQRREVAYDLVKGKDLKSLLASGDSRAKKAVTLLAEELQKLHDSEIHTPKYPKGDSPDEKKIRKNALNVLNKGKVNRDFVNNLQRKIREYIPKNKRLIHGDAHLGNFIFTNNDELYFIDPDEVKISDNHSDLGKVVYSIRQLNEEGKISKEEANELTKSFLEVYKGEDIEAIRLLELRTPVVEAKFGKWSSIPIAKRLLQGLKSRSLEYRLAPTASVIIILFVLALVGMKVTGKSISDYSSLTNNSYALGVILVLGLLIIFLIGYKLFKRKK